MKRKRIIEVSFNSEKEKLIIITKRILSTQEVESMLNLIACMDRNNILILPSELIEEIKIVRKKK